VPVVHVTRLHTCCI